MTDTEGSGQTSAMQESRRLRADLTDAVSGADSALGAADRLCSACVELLKVDGAAVSLVTDGATQGTFGSSSALSRQIDEFQYTFGEGPCLDAATDGAPVLIPDLGALDDARWPAFRAAALAAGINAVFALPVSMGSGQVVALDLYRNRSGRLSVAQLAGGLIAAELATRPLRELMDADLDWNAIGDQETDTGGTDQLATLERIEVYQATGMLIGSLDISAEEALVRLRAYAYTHDRTASDLAWDIVHRRIPINPEDWTSGPVSGDSL